MTSFSSGKRVLLVGNEGVALFGPTARGVEREIALSWELPNFDRQLTEALTEQNQSRPVVILFDGADQTYRKEENIPKLSFFDRARFVRRKLEMAFPSYPIRTSVLVKPSRKEGKNAPKESPSYLFMAIPETDRLDKVSANLLEAGVPVAGFGLLPAESEGLVTALSGKLFGKTGEKSHWAVLIGQHETGGLRQVVVKNGNLALTRMTPTSEAGVQGPKWVEEVMREFKATLTYIARFGYAADEGLDVVVICGDIEKQFFDKTSLPVTNFRCLKVADALALIGAKGVSLGETNFGDAVHAAWASRKRSLAVPVVVPGIRRIMAPRLAVRVATLLLAALLLGLGGISFREYQNYNGLQDEIARKQSRKTLLEHGYAQDSKVFDTLPVKPLLVNGTLAVRKFADGGSVRIAPTLDLLRRTLGSTVKLSSLMFENRAEISLKPGEERNPRPLRIVFRFTITDAPTLEQKVAAAEKLAESLRSAFPGYEIRINSQFGNVSRTGIFEGMTGDTPTPGNASLQEDAAEFEMQGAPL
ncbi:MAG: hypothetical protein V1721_03230 [Pseudomonadota bacterium]